MNEIWMWRHWPLLSLVCRRTTRLWSIHHYFLLRPVTIAPQPTKNRQRDAISMRVCSSSCVVYLLHHMLYAEYDVIDSSEIRGLLRKYFDSPGRFCTTGHFAMFEALYLRLTGSVFVPVKNVVFLMLRTFTRLSILNHRSFPLKRL